MNPLSECQQKALATALDVCAEESDKQVMVLRGSAGTGKTTLVHFILNEVKEQYDHVILLAPTNKAAQVLRRKSGIPAGMIHSMLYKPQETQDGYVVWIKNTPKKEQRVLIMVDEASMVGNRPTPDDIFSGSYLLSDLISYFQLCKAGSRLIFIGDACQLPPVGYDAHEKSPALEPEILEKEHKLPVAFAELKYVHRHAEGSYILDGATSLRNHILYQHPFYQVQPRYLQNVTAGIRHYMSRYDRYDEETVAMIAWTNRNVNWWNNVIRERLKLDAQTLMPETRVVIDRRCIMDREILQKGQMGYIADVTGAPHEFANLFFLPVRLQTFDEDGVVSEYNSLALIDHLISDRGTLTQEQEKFLKHEAIRTNEVYRKSNRPLDDPHMNALRLRYGYAFTCHKAQGSEFEEVIVHPYLPKDEPRWLYTAVTRAKQELFSF